MRTRSIALAALFGFAAIGAQAFEGEQNPLPQQPFHSSMARSTVRMQAQRPVAISNGGTGVQMQSGMADRATVRAGGRAISANGAATYGEVSGS